MSGSSAAWRVGAVLAWACLLSACPRPPGPSDGGADGGVDGGLACPATFRLRPSVSATTVTLVGEWDGFDRSLARPMADDGTGGYEATLQLPPGTWGYAFLVNGAEQLDPANGAVRVVDGHTWSRLVLADCRLASLAVVSSTVTFGQRRYEAVLDVTAPATATVRVEGSVRVPSDHVAAGWQPRALTPAELALSTDGRRATVSLAGLPDGKYTVRLRAFSDERPGDDLLLPFWMEPTPFSFRDSPLYMLVTDRFRDGDPSNTPARTTGVPFSADFQGGDLKGVELAITEGYFDQLGVKALWLTPWQTQPSGAYQEQNGANQVMGYHGYWPIRAREVDPRLGGADALHRLVEEAHRHGIRIVMDTVLNHVHEEHEYFKDAGTRAWFRTGCVCGTANCGWDDKRLECLFTPYMPDIDWTVGEAADQLLADVQWWVEEFDLDGLRVDAVKHVEDSAITSLGTRMRARFEAAGTDFYMFGETFSDDYGLINHSIGPTALDAQLDFPLFMQVPETVFATDTLGFLHVKYWTEQSQTRFGGAPMVTFVGNHDVARFITKADPANRALQGNKWSNLPGAPVGQEPYDRLWLAFLNLLTSPGVPLIYYGDEYGEFGGSDPDNRHLANREATFWPEQRAQLARMRALGAARAKLRGLRRGPLETLWANTEDNGKGNLWAYYRTDPDPRQAALVVLNRTGGTWPGVVVRFPSALGWTSGTVYDLLTNREWAIANGEVSLDVPARSGVVLGLR